TLREDVRARLRVMVRRVLRKHGYPPDKQEKATQTVIEQAELLSGEWAAARRLWGARGSSQGSSPRAVHQHRPRLVRVAAGFRGGRRHGKEREAVARCIAGGEEGDAAAPPGGEEPAAHALERRVERAPHARFAHGDR